MKSSKVILSCLIRTLLVATASATWKTVTDPVPLKSLQGSFFLDVGDKRFSNFDLDITIVNGDPFITDPNNMKVQGVEDDEGKYGLRFNGFLWYAGANQAINVNLGFKISVLPGYDANYINGVSLLLTGANVTGNGTVDASEIVWDDFPGGSEIAHPKCWYYANNSQLSDSQNFKPLKEIYVETKNITLIGWSGSAQFSNFFQFYSQIPEPATVVLLGTASIWVFTRKKRSA
jgi:type V secretory pathway adhesin AidA